MSGVWGVGRVCGVGCGSVCGMCVRVCVWKGCGSGSVGLGRECECVKERVECLCGWV